mmetsp:Transcript_56324/g.168622  ORF Transcript_56324/g.168622 Transcript_56324/m.168622 type:complete len:224 (-) Transcript_56324:3210-3881(-)
MTGLEQKLFWEGVTVGTNLGQVRRSRYSHPLGNAVEYGIPRRGSDETSTTDVVRTRRSDIVGERTEDVSTPQTSSEHEVVAPPGVIGTLTTVGGESTCKVRCLHENRILPQTLRLELLGEGLNGAVHFAEAVGEVDLNHGVGVVPSHGDVVHVAGDLAYIGRLHQTGDDLKLTSESSVGEHVLNGGGVQRLPQRLIGRQGLVKDLGPLLSHDPRIGLGGIVDV